MMGRLQVEQAALFYEFSLERHVPPDHLLRSIDRFVDAWRTEAGAGSILQLDGSAVGRSRADDPDADRRLLLRHPLGAAAVRGGSPEPGLSVVLPARARRRGARPLDLLEEPPWPLPRQRSAARVFETVVRRCMAEGLVGGDGFAVDASLIKADANRQHGSKAIKGSPPEAVEPCDR